MTNTFQIGLKVRTICRLGYQTHTVDDNRPPLSDAEYCNNKCIVERDLRSLSCGVKGWPQSEWVCAGNNNGKELDRCMYTCWSPAELELERSTSGGPYNSSLGDKCFNEFIGRYRAGAALNANKAEWERCVATFQ